MSGAGACTLLVDTGELSTGAGDGATDGSASGDVVDASSDQSSASDSASQDSSSTEGGPTAGYAAAVLADTPLLYLRLDEPAGEKAVKDLSTNANVGTLHGNVALGVEGALAKNGAAMFQGGYVDVGKKFGFEGTASFTVEAWVKPVFNSNFHAIMARSERLTVAPFTITGGWFWVQNANTKTVVFVRQQNTSDADSVSVTLDDTKPFHHIAVTYDGMTLRAYLDGAERASNGSTKPLPSLSTSFVIGGDSDGNASPFLGVIDEVSLYDHALPAARISAHYLAAISN